MGVVGYQRAPLFRLTIHAPEHSLFRPGFPKKPGTPSSLQRCGSSAPCRRRCSPCCSLTGDAIRTFTSELNNGTRNGRRPGTVHVQRRGQLSWQARHSSARVAQKVGVVMCVTRAGSEGVPIHTVRATGNRSDARVSKLYQITKDGGGIPVRIPQAFQYIGVRHRAFRCSENHQYGDAGSRRSKASALK